MNQTTALIASALLLLPVKELPDDNYVGNHGWFHDIDSVQGLVAFNMWSPYQWIMYRLVKWLYPKDAIFDRG